MSSIAVTYVTFIIWQSGFSELFLGKNPENDQSELVGGAPSCL